MAVFTGGRVVLDRTEVAPVGATMVNAGLSMARTPLITYLPYLIGFGVVVLCSKFAMEYMRFKHLSNWIQKLFLMTPLGKMYQFVNIDDTDLPYHIKFQKRVGNYTITRNQTIEATDFDAWLNSKTINPSSFYGDQYGTPVMENSLSTINNDNRNFDPNTRTFEQRAKVKKMLQSFITKSKM